VGLAFTAWLWFRFKLNYRVDLFSAGFQEKKMNEEIEKQNPAHETDNRENASASVDGVNQSRRRFGLAGLAAPAVMLSLASKPVMGASYWCTGSGGMSGNTSGHGTKLSCLACSPGYWKTSPGTWPKPYYPYDGWVNQEIQRNHLLLGVRVCALRWEQLNYHDVGFAEHAWFVGISHCWRTTECSDCGCHGSYLRLYGGRSHQHV
jgi:hypothetical protein